MIRVFVGTSQEHARADAVLEYSIRKHTSSPFEITFMRPGDLPISGGVTGFTFFRFAVPWLCDGEGFAIYLDSDMLLLDDIAKLWDQRLAGKWVRHEHPEGDCVSVIDCEAAYLEPELINQSTKWELRQMLQGIYSHTLSDDWNSLDNVEGASLVHYTAMTHQPWLSDTHPDSQAKNLWLEMERECRLSA